MAHAEERSLLDALTCLHERTTLDRAGLAALREAGLKSVQLSFQDDRPA